MNREIKFRAWNTAGEYFYPLDDDGDYYFRLEDNLCLYDKYGECENVVLQQYTGLNDKNGKEIYDGDVIKIWTKRKEGYDYDTIVSWVNGAWEFQTVRDDFKFPFVHFLSLFAKDSEVIGNIYQNPELLNNETQNKTAQESGEGTGTGVQP